MSTGQYDHHQAPVVYPPPPPQSYPAVVEGYAPGPYVVPPPAGYPTKDSPQQPPHRGAETQSRGDGFWKGVCAGLCCCCCLDMCF